MPRYVLISQNSGIGPSCANAIISPQTLGKKQISEIRSYPPTWNGQLGEDYVTITLKIDDVE